MNAAATEGLAQRLRTHYPQLDVRTGSSDPAGFDLVVNATPLGMNPGDPMPMDVNRIAPDAFVGEVVMKTEMTAFLEAAKARGCRYQIGSDMLFEQIPAYLEYFGLPSTTPDELRAVATPEMVGYFSEQLSELASRGVRNMVTNVHLEQGDLSEAWAEPGREYATVAMRFSMIDVTVDTAGHVVDGNPNQRTQSTEVWTFLRAPGGRWLLSAIQQTQ